MGHQHLRRKYCQISYKSVSFSFLKVHIRWSTQKFRDICHMFFFCYQFIQCITFRFQIKILYLKVDLSTILFWSLEITEAILDTNNKHMTFLCAKYRTYRSYTCYVVFFSLHINTLCRNIFLLQLVLCITVSKFAS